MAEKKWKTIYDDGMEQGARHFVLLQGRKLFGEPPPEIVLALQQIEDLERFDRMTLQILDVFSWTELLETM